MDKATHVTIINFTKYNARKDVTHSTWFRFEHSIFEKPEFFEFTHTEKMAWIYLLCLASKKNADSFTLSWPHLEKIGGFKRKDFEKALKKLQEIQAIHVDVTDAVRARYVDDTSTSATDRQTDKTDITRQDTTETPVGLLPLSPQDLINLWNENSKTLPKASRLTESRSVHCRAQLKKYHDLDHWTQALVKFTGSEFCMNQWKPTFDDFLNESKRISAIEGRYDSKSFVKEKNSKHMSVTELLKLQEASSDS